MGGWVGMWLVPAGQKAKLSNLLFRILLCLLTMSRGCSWVPLGLLLPGETPCSLLGTSERLILLPVIVARLHFSSSSLLATIEDLPPAELSQTSYWKILSGQGYPRSPPPPTH